MRIKWIEVDALRHGFGHGIEFLFRMRQEDGPQPIAIIEGYDWYHDPAQKTVTVKILSRGAAFFGYLTEQDNFVLKEIRRAVKLFFEAGPREGQITKDIYAWWNA